MSKEIGEVSPYIGLLRAESGKLHLVGLSKSMLTVPPLSKEETLGLAWSLGILKERLMQLGLSI